MVVFAFVSYFFFSEASQAAELPFAFVSFLFFSQASEAALLLLLLLLLPLLLKDLQVGPFFFLAFLSLFSPPLPSSLPPLPGLPKHCTTAPGPVWKSQALLAVAAVAAAGAAPPFLLSPRSLPGLFRRQEGLALPLQGRVPFFFLVFPCVCFTHPSERPTQRITRHLLLCLFHPPKRDPPKELPDFFCVCFTHPRETHPKNYQTIVCCVPASVRFFYANFCVRFIIMLILRPFF